MHEWNEGDDIVALFFERFGPESLGVSIEDAAKTLGIPIGSMKMRVQNFRSLSGGAGGLPHVASLSREVFKAYGAQSRDTLRGLALLHLSKELLIYSHLVIPAKAGIQKIQQHGPRLSPG